MTRDSIREIRIDKPIRYSLRKMELQQAMKKRKTRARISLLRRAAKIQRLCYAVVYAF